MSHTTSAALGSRAARRAEYDSTTTKQWSDPDTNDGAWPYPTSYVERTITGELARAVRARFGVSTATPVTITEEEISGGWSETTQETDYGMTIRCGKHKIEFWDDPTGNFNAMLHWLDRSGSSTPKSS